MKNPVTKFVKEAYQELKKVSWPKKGDVARSTIVVVISIIATAALIGALDYGLYNLTKLLISLN